MSQKYLCQTSMNNFYHVTLC